MVYSAIYPKHLDHNYSHFSGLKHSNTLLFDCNENRTEELIALLKKLSNDVIPYNNGIIVEPVFFLEKLIRTPHFQRDSGNYQRRIKWNGLNLVASEILKTWFFKNEDICKELREVLNDPEHSENYWLSGALENERGQNNNIVLDEYLEMVNRDS
uniref:Uncharacterized protein n=1 Tax=Magallana gigas TaxID=29159 RepID=K1P6E5_MAGGI